MVKNDFYEHAREKYAEIGIDTDAALKTAVVERRTAAAAAKILRKPASERVLQRLCEGVGETYGMGGSLR